MGSGRLAVGAKESHWLERLESELEALPDTEEDLIEEMKSTYAGQFDPASYGLEA